MALALEMGRGHDALAVGGALHAGHVLLALVGAHPMRIGVAALGCLRHVLDAGGERGAGLTSDMLLALRLAQPAVGLGGGGAGGRRSAPGSGRAVMAGGVLRVAVAGPVGQGDSGNESEDHCDCGRRHPAVGSAQCCLLGCLITGRVYRFRELLSEVKTVECHQSQGALDECRPHARSHKPPGSGLGWRDRGDSTVG